jgi:predicted nucleic acid-binding protein
MSGSNLFVDTNILLLLLNGNHTIAESISEQHIFISFITELELLGHKGITTSEQKVIKRLLNECVVIDINENIKKEVVKIRQQKKIKLPDAIIAATAIYLDLPLLSADKDFSRIDHLNLLLFKA